MIPAHAPEAWSGARPVIVVASGRLLDRKSAFFGSGAGGGIRTRTVAQRILSPQRLPFRHARKRQPGVFVAEDTRNNKKRTRRPVFPFAMCGAEDGIRTRDLLLGKEMLYH